MLGVVKEVEERRCTETKEHAIAWDVTSKIPTGTDYKRLKDMGGKTFWILFSEQSGCLGYACPDKETIDIELQKWLKRPGFEDTKIFKANGRPIQSETSD